jgi:hypothetical protein
MLVMFISQIVAKPIGQFLESAFQFIPEDQVRCDLIQRGIDAAEPSVAFGGADRQMAMPLSQPRMTAPRRVLGWAAKPFAEIEFQNGLHRSEIVRVHGADRSRLRTRIHIPVEGLDKPIDAVIASDEVEIRTATLSSMGPVTKTCASTANRV